MKIKLTNQNGQSYGGMQWGPGVTHGPTSGEGELCGPGWLHFYEGLGVALLHNPLGANFENPRAWIAKAHVGKRGGLKVGTQTLTTVREIFYTPPTIEQRLTVVILLAFDKYDPAWDRGQWATWAVDWLSGTNRTRKAADAAAIAADVTADATVGVAAYAVADAAAYAADVTADVTADAAYAVADAAYADAVADATVGMSVKHVDAVACAVFGY